ncbi:hypothetical protein EIQ28_08295 [Xanthomonas campestris pv. plantaginis]
MRALRGFGIDVCKRAADAHCVAITTVPVLLVARQRCCRSRNSRQECSGRLCGVISIVRQCAALA